MYSFIFVLSKNDLKICSITLSRYIITARVLFFKDKINNLLWEKLENN